MRVQTMRHIDYWLGIPLCFLASIVHKLRQLVAPTALLPPRKVLFIELSEMGSTILADPAMQKLRRASGAALYFLIFESRKESLQLLSTIPAAHVYTLRDTNLFTLGLDVLRYVVWARRQGIDTVIDLELFSRLTALLSWASDACNRVGFYAYHHEGLYRGTLLTHNVSYNPHQHIAKNFLALVAALLATSPEVPYAKVRISDDDIRVRQVTYAVAEQQRMWARIQQAYPDYDPHRHALVLVNPNASELLPQRRWMPDKYVALMQRILAQHPTVLVC